MNRNELRDMIESEAFKGIPKNFFYRLYYRIFVLPFSPNRMSLYLVRKLQYFYSKNSKITRFFSRYYQNLLAEKYGLHVSPSARIGKGLRLPHPVGIVIGARTIIGKNVTIYQNCTIGGARTGDVKKGNQPIIGDNVTLFSGAMALGNIRIKDGSILGAGTILTRDAEISGIYVGCPARLIREFNDEKCSH